MGSDRADHLALVFYSTAQLFSGRPLRGLKTLSPILQKGAYCCPLSHINGSYSLSHDGGLKVILAIGAGSAGIAIPV
jgi:hypothetical protein